MKEIPKRYTNPFLSNEENEKVDLWNQEPEHSNIEDDLTTNYEDDRLIICYKEGAFDVKDICVDEGIPHGEKISFDEDNEMLKPELLELSTVEDYYLESNACLTVPETSNDHMKIEDNEEVIDSIVPNELREMSKDDISNEDGLFGSDTVLKAVYNNDPDISLQPGEELINSSGISSLQQDRPLPSLKSLLDSIDRQPCQSPVEKVSERPVENESAMEENTTSNMNKTEPATRSGVHNIENLERVDELSIEPHDVLTINHGGEGDSSFSVAGPISGLITYSGHIGSASLRSDSSTTSTRSFAFPILQNEWNSSPVRMAKADQRRLLKHRGWRHGLLCCRF